MMMRDFNTIMEEFLREAVREDAVRVYRSLLDKKNVSEFDLAEELNLNINAVRNILYSLHEHNLVYSIRKKDKEKGWYIYYWTFNMKYAKEVLLKRKREYLEKINKQISDENTKTFYKCPDNHVKVSVEEAMDYGFRCKDCEKVLIEEKEKFAPGEKAVAQVGEDIKIVEDYEITEIQEVAKEGEKKPIKKAKKKKAERKTKKRSAPKQKSKKRKIARKAKKKKAERKTKKRSAPKQKSKKRKIARKAKKKKAERKTSSHVSTNEDNSPKKSILGRIRKKVRRLSF